MISLNLDFNLGDFYVSPLVFKHVLFEGTPWIPLAFLIHDRKLQKCNNRFFEFLAERIPLLKSKRIPFVTDKDPALTKSALKYFPQMQIIHCWNHLKRNFKEELRKLEAGQTETMVYLSDWKKMTHCESEDEFYVTYEDLASKWTASVILRQVHEKRSAEIFRALDC